MSKKNKIFYWVSTIWLALGMFSTGIVQLIQMEEEVEKMAQLGYPSYLMTILGVWKFFGVIVILIPKFPLLKEWAYAGFFFVMSSAVISHLVMEDDIVEIVPALLLLVLIAISWYFRPSSRKLITTKR